jgi:hypothetical protein
MNGAHKATNEAYRDGYDLTFKKDAKVSPRFPACSACSCADCPYQIMMNCERCSAEGKQKCQKGGDDEAIL